MFYRDCQRSCTFSIPLTGVLSVSSTDPAHPVVSAKISAARRAETDLRLPRSLESRKPAPPRLTRAELCFCLGRQPHSHVLNVTSEVLTLSRIHCKSFDCALSILYGFERDAVGSLPRR